VNPQLIIAALIAAAGFGTAWKIQGFRMDAKEKEHVEQILDAERRAAAKAIRNQETVIAAQSEAARRAAVLRRDAAGARDAADGLRNDIERVRTEAAQSHTACIERADAISELLGAVEEAGRGMAQKADLHASDLKTLMDAWPKD